MVNDDATKRQCDEGGQHQDRRCFERRNALRLLLPKDGRGCGWNERRRAGSALSSSLTVSGGLGCCCGAVGRGHQVVGDITLCPSGLVCGGDLFVGEEDWLLLLVSMVHGFIFWLVHVLL